MSRRRDFTVPVVPRVPLNLRATAASILSPISLITNAVVANWFVLVPALGVGAVGVPVNSGLSIGALVFSRLSSFPCNSLTSEIS